MHRAALIAVSILFVVGSCLSQDMAKKSPVRGTVFTRDPDGRRSVVPGARIVLLDAITRETQSDAQGAYSFGSVPAGRYVIEASAPGLKATTTIEVTTGIESVIPIELDIAAVTSAVTVTSSDPAPIEESAQHNTINQSLVEKAPNQNERFENPLSIVGCCPRAGWANQHEGRPIHSGRLARELGERNRPSHRRPGDQSV